MQPPPPTVEDVAEAPVGALAVVDEEILLTQLGFPSGENATTDEVAVQSKWRQKFDRLWYMWAAASIQIKTLRGAYARAALVCGAMIGLNTVRASAAMPAGMCNLVASWEGFRAANRLAVTFSTAFGMYTATDVLSQTFAQQLTGAKSVQLSLRRIFNSGLTSGFLGGFVGYFYHHWIASIPVLKLIPGGSKIGEQTFLGTFLPALARVGFDVGVYEPLYTCIYIAIQAVLRGQPRSIPSELKAKVMRIWRLAPRFWVPFGMTNFAFTPVNLRPIVTSLATIPWTMYLSSMSNRGATSAQEPVDYETIQRDLPEAELLLLKDYARLILNLQAMDSNGDQRIDRAEFERFWEGNRNFLTARAYDVFPNFDRSTEPADPGAWGDGRGAGLLMPSIDIESTRDDANMVQSGLADAGGLATSADELAEQAARGNRLANLASATEGLSDEEQAEVASNVLQDLAGRGVDVGDLEVMAAIEVVEEARKKVEASGSDDAAVSN